MPPAFQFAHLLRQWIVDRKIADEVRRWFHFLSPTFIAWTMDRPTCRRHLVEPNTESRTLLLQPLLFCRKRARVHAWPTQSAPATPRLDVATLGASALRLVGTLLLGQGRDGFNCNSGCNPYRDFFSWSPCCNSCRGTRNHNRKDSNPQMSWNPRKAPCMRTPPVLQLAHFLFLYPSIHMTKGTDALDSLEYTTTRTDLSSPKRAVIYTRGLQNLVRVCCVLPEAPGRGVFTPHVIPAQAGIHAAGATRLASKCPAPPPVRWPCAAHEHHGRGYRRQRRLKMREKNERSLRSSEAYSSGCRWHRPWSALNH